MKILYCIPHLYNSGGMERVLTQKVNWLVAHTAHEVSIVTTESTPSGMPQCCFVLDNRVKVISLDINFDADYYKPLWSKWMGHMRRMRAYESALTNYIRTQQIDICISLCGKEVAFLKELPCRTIAEMHFAKDQRKQLLLANHKGILWSFFGNIRTRQLVRAVKPLERLVVLTEADKKDWNKVGCHNVTVIPNPCCLDGGKMPMKPKENHILLAVGRLHEQKGFDCLLKAWSLIEKNHSDWSLRIVGEGQQRASLEQQINALKLQKVLLVGQTNEVLREYTSSSIFVLSSRYEGLPLSLIEAMWCELPCVAFDCPQGPKELLGTDKGWLVPNGDVEALAQQLEYVMTHPKEAEKRAHKAQLYAHQAYSEAAIMPLWLELIEK